MKLNRLWQMGLLIVFLIVLDQWSKDVVQSSFYLGESLHLIPGFFSLTYVHNPGAAWGMGADADNWLRYLMFRYVPVLVCGGLVYLIVKSVKTPYYMTIAYSLILAGAVGNLIDRFRLDYVIDFFDFYYDTWHFPAFNVADSAITVGGALLVLDYILELKNKKAATHGS